MTQPAPKPARTPSQRGKAAKKKGGNAEREAARILGGERVPLSGSLGGKLSGDATDAEGRIYEIKTRANGFRQLYTWLRIVPGHGVQTIKRTLGVERGRERPPFALALRADNSPWLVVMLLDDWCAAMDREANLRAEVGK